MPECYTHVYLANQALRRSGNTVGSFPAFTAGANGPDPLYNYHIWKKKRTPDLPALAARMHRENTGVFLLSMIRYATTPVQQSYVLGFVSHYAASCTLNPYMDAMSQKGYPFNIPNGRWIMGASLDSTLYYRDYKTLTVPLHAGTPVLITDDLAQVSSLLRQAVSEAYEMDVPLLALADAFHDNMMLHKLMISRTRMKKPILSLMVPKDSELYGGPFTARMQPARRLPRLPQDWANPYTGEAMALLLDEVLAVAEQTGAICIAAVMRYWLGELDENTLITVLGNNDYFTGLPCTTSGNIPTQPEWEGSEAP